MLILKHEQQKQHWWWADWFEASKMFMYLIPRKYPGLTLKTNGNVTHPFARFSIPQYSSASSLQGLEVLLQPASSDMSPQSSSPLHWRVLWIQRPDGEEERLALCSGLLQNKSSLSFRKRTYSSPCCKLDEGLMPHLNAKSQAIADWLNEVKNLEVNLFGQKIVQYKHSIKL